MASIYNNSGIWYLGWLENGKKRGMSLKLKATKQNKKFAEQYKIDKERELSKGIITQNIKLFEGIDLFITSRKNKAIKTILRYKLSLSWFSRYMGDVRIDSIKDSEIINYEQHLIQNTKSQSTLETFIRDLRIFLKYMRENYSVGFVKIRKEKRGQNRSIKVIPNETEILEYFKNRNVEHCRYLKLLFLTGFRKFEAINLDWSNIDFNEKVINFKNDKANRIDVFPLYDELNTFLETFRSSGKVFTFNDSAHIGRTLKSKFGYTIKDIRSTFATKNARKFRSFELKELLRHRDAKTTEKYYVNVDVRSLADRF